MTTIAVTGSTGVLGRMVAEQLAAAGLQQRLLVRSPERAPELAGVTVVQSDYSSVTEQLDGVDVLFMVSAAEDEHRRDQHSAFVDAAARAGVGHIVYTSFYGASPTATFTLARDHDFTEKRIAATGMAHTFLRDNLYLDFMDALVGDDGVIRGPAGDGRVAAVAREDIARVAAAVIQSPASHRNTTYNLTGSEALTLAKVAAILSAHRGTEVRFQNETHEEAYASREKYGAPGWQVDAWVSTYTAIASGELSGVSNDVQLVTGLPPLTLAELLAR